MFRDKQLDAHQLDGVIKVINTTWVDPWVGGVGSFISHTGSYAAFFAALFLALALGLAKKPRGRRSWSSRSAGSSR